jgi:hypothetical protein
MCNAKPNLVEILKNKVKCIKNNTIINTMKSINYNIFKKRLESVDK